MPIRVAITGTLSRPRKEIIEMIETRTGAEFSRGVTYDTNYLVAARFDTSKAKKAAQIGVTVISEADLMRYIEQGAFPENATPAKSNRIGHRNFPEVEWTHFERDRIVVRARGLGAR